MFERYTEKARRVIFFARYDASQFGSAYIDTEHLLLGLLREDKAFARQMLSPDPEASTESIRRQIENRVKVGKKISTSVDLPLSEESKRVLVFAAEEAERLGHKHIGTEHLLLGMLREPGSLATEVLKAHGVSLEAGRVTVSRAYSTVDAPADIVTIHGEGWDHGYIQSQVKALRKFAWRKREWKPLDLAVEVSSGRISFDLTLKDEPGIKIQAGGWTHDFCAVCQWELNASGGEEHAFGYTNGREWLCSECYEKFFGPPDSGPAFDELT